MQIDFRNIQCPHYEAEYVDRIPISFNTFGLLYYTDGYQTADFYPNFPRVFQCVNQQCCKIFDLDEKSVEVTSGADDESLTLIAWNTIDLLKMQAELDLNLSSYDKGGINKKIVLQ